MREKVMAPAMIADSFGFYAILTDPLGDYERGAREKSRPEPSIWMMSMNVLFSVALISTK
jgi:hypothetical protein